MHATTIGVDLAKRVFEVAVANRNRRVIARHRFTRAQFERFLRTQPPLHVVLEACGTAHFWARFAGEHGHRVGMLPPQYVRPYVRRNKTDRTDAEALLEAVRSDRIHPVSVKTVLQQELLALHRIRAQWMATRTARINALRGFLQEHGITIVRGAAAAMSTIPSLLENADWQTAVLKAHGHTRVWAWSKSKAKKGTGKLASASLEQFRTINLHFHDRAARGRLQAAGSRLAAA